jgi:4-alpha-glucanotransferase
MRTDAQWKKIGLRPHHGIALPLSALHSNKSCGIGEFLDLIPLIDWCKSIHFDVIQLLPLNDTGDDRSPYNPISSCALDPVYLSLRELNDSGLDPFLSFTQLGRLAQFEVKQQKMKWLHRYFEESFSPSKEYRAFLEKNPWVRIYALFKAIKDEYGGKSWTQWPNEFQTPREEDFAAKQKSVDFHSFLQFLCFYQMKQVREYATSQGVFLKGDIPILLSPDSADVWAHRSLFRLDLAAGAPPDAYNRLGQKWGFPLFNWEAMREDNFSWWRQRLSVLENPYHIYRIDHIVGFFRIWGIPKEKKPTEGSFFPSDWNLWWSQGREILEMMIDSSSLLPVAEDLGTIPKEVPPILKELGICGTKVLRWQRRFDGDKRYIPFAEYEPLSLATVSTPDLDLLQIWWKKFPEEAIPFAHFKEWPYSPELTAEQRLSILRDIHHAPSYFHINLLQEYLALFPELVSPNPEDERINVPGTLLPTNWTYRFRPSIEEILAHQPLAEAIRNILG